MNKPKPSGKKCYPIDLAMRMEQFINDVAKQQLVTGISIEHRDATLEAIKLQKEIKA